jgi:predicted secreted acid phosphatase
MNKELSQCVKELSKFVKKHILHRTEKNLAVIFDIDETLMLSEQMLMQDSKQNDKYHVVYSSNAIKGMVDIYNLIKKSGISIYLLTARPEHYRYETIEELDLIGYPQGSYKKIFLRPKRNSYDDDDCVCFYKERVRKQITEEDSKHIILNVGDQNTDLMGGYFEFGWKFPSSYNGNCKHIIGTIVSKTR